MNPSYRANQRGVTNQPRGTVQPGEYAPSNGPKSAETARSCQKTEHGTPKKRKRIWSAGRDLNPRLYGFAGRSLGPLGHRRGEPQRTGDKPRGRPGASGRRPS